MKCVKPVKITKAYIKKRAKLAWKLFSKRIRERDKGTCIACGAVLGVKKTQAGHFIHGKLNFNEMNINAECPRCNWRLHGNLSKYAIALVKRYGLEAIEQLFIDAENHKGYSIEEIEEVIDNCK